MKPAGTRSVPAEPTKFKGHKNPELNVMSSHCLPEPAQQTPWRCCAFMQSEEGRFDMKKTLSVMAAAAALMASTAITPVMAQTADPATPAAPAAPADPATTPMEDNSSATAPTAGAPSTDNAAAPAGEASTD